MKSANLKRGDVLLVHNSKRQHTAIYCGNNTIVSARINEKGTTKGGKKGDQTGREICTSPFDPSYPWETVLRYKDEAKADAATLFAESIAADDSHGYDQINRQGPDFDCSSLVIASYKSVGVETTSTYTGNMKSGFKKAGFVEVDPNETKTEPIGEASNLYIVKKGDTLTKIAKESNTTVAELVRINGIKDPDVIRVGQKIYLPAKVTIEPKKLTGTVHTISSPLRVRQKPSTSSGVLRLLPKGSRVELMRIVGEWGELSGGGFVYMAYIDLD